MPCLAWSCISTEILVVWVFPWSLGVNSYDRRNLSEGHKNFFKDQCLVNSQSAFWFLPLFWIILSYYLKYVNQITLNCTALWVYQFTNIFLDANLTLNQTLVTFLLYVRQTTMTQLILVFSVTHMHGLAVCVKGLVSFCTGFTYRKLCRLLFRFFTGCTSFSALLLFPLSTNFFFFVHGFCCYFIWNRWCSLHHSICLWRLYNVHHKDWLTYCGGTDRPGEFCHNFSISNDLTQMVNCPTGIPECDSQSPPLLDLFLYSDASIGSKTTFPFLGNSDHVVISVSFDFPSNSKGNNLFIA